MQHRYWITQKLYHSRQPLSLHPDTAKTARNINRLRERLRLDAWIENLSAAIVVIVENPIVLRKFAQC
ncbi:hypothetical protein [Paracoccus sp. (in: a-proteobacteria)]|uniref:hypothetical protein n=1 Tax=Paracoccus sp. TaxID=267 RepID=UPI002899EABE|nr:hypothetical protein [Paracoccus sp. (in: a-proteobacteria)]